MLKFLITRDSFWVHHFLWQPHVFHRRVLVQCAPRGAVVLPLPVCARVQRNPALKHECAPPAPVQIRLAGENGGIRPRLFHQARQPRRSPLGRTARRRRRRARPARLENVRLPVEVSRADASLARTFCAAQGDRSLSVVRLARKRMYRVKFPWHFSPKSVLYSFRALVSTARNRHARAVDKSACFMS